MEKTLRIRFIGGIGTVTGSCTMLEFTAPGYTNLYLVDIGDYQSERGNELGKAWLLKRAADIQGVFLTHSHVDHIGLLPDLARAGFTGRIYCTKATAELSKLMLLDSLAIKEPDTDRSEHIALVSKLRFFVLDDNGSFEFGKTHFPLCQDLQFVAFRSSHVLGSCSWAFRWSRQLDDEDAGNDKKTWTWIHFSGDIGTVYQKDRPGIMFKELQTPYYGKDNKYIVMESTYGDRVREKKGDSFHERIDLLSTVIRETMLKGGNVLIPAFAQNRAQELLLDLSYIANAKPVYVPPFQKQWRIDNNRTLGLSLKDGDVDKAETVSAIWKRFMGAEPFDPECRYADMPDEMQDELLRVDNEGALASGRGKTFTANYFSGLLGKVNDVYVNHLCDSYMTDKGDIKYKYLSPLFGEAFGIDDPSVKDMRDILEDALSPRLAFRKTDKSSPMKPDIEERLRWGNRVIVSSSGMCDDGAIMVLLRPILTDPNSTVVITGYQGIRTNGYTLAHLEEYTEQERYNGTLDNTDIRLSEIRCRIVNLAQYYSGHADQEQLVEYVTGRGNARMKNNFPTTVFLNHGVDTARAALKDAILAKSPEGNIAVELPTTDSWYNLNSGLEEPLEAERIDIGPVGANDGREPPTGTKSVTINGITVSVPNGYGNGKLVKIMDFLQTLT